MNTLRKINFRAALSLVTAVVAISPGMVNADSLVVATKTIHFSTDSARTASGARELYAHIREAAYTVCGVTSPDSDRQLRRPSACVDDAIAGAVRDVRSPQLTQRYVQLNGTEAAAKNGVDSAIRTAQR